MPSVEEPETTTAEAPDGALQAPQLTTTEQAVQERASASPATLAVSPAAMNIPPAASNGSLAVEALHEEPVCASVDDAVVEDPSDDEAQEAQEDADEPSPVVGTLEEAEELFGQGRQALGSGKYDQAAELLSRALEIRAHHHGELASECAFTYYKYGCALLYKAQSEADPLGGVKETGNVEDEEDVEDDEESDLDMAWKMLDIARVIYEKQHSHSIEEVDVITALADVSLEREDFEMCLRDYTRALEILEGLVEPDHRGIAELCFKLSLALQLGYKPKEALKYCQQAVSVCEARLARLKNEVSTVKGLVGSKGKAPIWDGSFEVTYSQEAPPLLKSDVSEATACPKQEKEIKEIEELLDDLREKVLELQNMASGPSLLESLKETNPAAVESITQVFKVTAELAGQGGSSGSSSQAQPSPAFDAPTNLASTLHVTDLGVVGRGVKRATPIPISNGQEASHKKRSLDDMMTRGGAGDTQIGFGSSSNSD